jgi:hypothetical protein
MKKTVLCLFLAIVSVLSFSKTLTIWIGGQVAELDETWNSVIKTFEEKYGISVEVQLVWF